MYHIQYKEKAGSEVRDWHVTVIRQVLETVKQLLADGAVEITITEFDNDMEEHPEVLAIEWDQYTPYFSDGDPCTFSINEPTISLTPKFIASLSKDELQVLSETQSDLYTISSYYLEKLPASEIKTKLEKLEGSIQEFYVNIQKLDTVLEEAFGDHMTVRITPKGKTKKTECEHD